MMKKKLRSRRGLTLAETLTALAVFAILSAALVQGTQAAWKVYRKAVVASEARTLQSTLAQSLSNELRYASNIKDKEEPGKVFFDSATFGEKVYVSNSDAGRLQIVQVKDPDNPVTYDLLPEKTYTSGLQANGVVAYSDGLFTLTITISHPFLPADGRKTTLTIQAMNPTPPTENPTAHLVGAPFF